MIVTVPPANAVSLFADTEDEMLRALRHQGEQCRRLGSPMYARLFADLAEDYKDNGRTFAMLAGRSSRPVHDAIPLRLAAAVHRIVLEGRDDRLARHYPTVGGAPGEDFTADFIAHMREHQGAIDAGLVQQVQTNEIGRSVVPMVLSHWMTRFGIERYEHWEIGASAGLNLNFDRYYASKGHLRMGDPESRVRFPGRWFANAPLVARSRAEVTRRRGVDVSPIDTRERNDRTRLLSFVWPDQRERFARITEALTIMDAHPVVVDPESADTWLIRHLAGRSDQATMVFHSIVWQYLGRDVQHRFRGALEQAGAHATERSPLLWARMEPAGETADVQVTLWRGRGPEHFRLATIGYHGQDMRWLDSDGDQAS